MNAVVVVMLVWVGSGNSSGPAFMQGFETLGACERAIPAVREFYSKNRVWSRPVEAECKSFPTR